MVALPGSLYLVSTGVFSLFAIVIGIRLVALSRRMSPAAEGITSITMLCTSAFGIATIFSYWLTFFPPAWYRKRLRTPVASETST